MSWFRGVVHWTGRAMITLGLLTFLFVAFQLWGTNLLQARSQDSLKSQFRRQLERVQATTTTSASTPTTTTSTAGPTTTTTLPFRADALRPSDGDVIGIIDIPRIGVNQAIVEGIRTADLRRGPGHYRETSLPGFQGNTAIAGHRTTYGAPFYRLDELEPGDPIVVTTLAGEFTYRVTRSYDVVPTNLDPVKPTSDARLTLTTCTPRFSARRRLIVVAELQGSDIGKPPPLPPDVVAKSRARDHGETTPAPDSLDGPTGSGFAGLDLAVVLWGLAALAAGGIWWWAFRRRPRLSTWLIGFVVLLPVLFVFFVQVERVLPTNY